MKELSIADIAQVFNGKTPSTSDQRTEGYPVLKIKDTDSLGNFKGNFESFVDPSYAKKYAGKNLKSGDFLILNAAHSASHVGSKTFYAKSDHGSPLITGEWLVVRTDGTFALPEYIRYYLSSEFARKQFERLVKGIHLYPKDVGRVKLNIPTLTEQRRIAAILDKAEALRTKRREAIAKLDQLLQSVFLEMFGDPVATKINWPLLTLETVATTRLGKMLDKKTSQGDNMKKYLANFNVQWGRFILNDLREMNFDAADQQEFNLLSGDILMCEGGDPGRCAIWEDDIKDCYFQKALHRIRCNKERCTPEYISYLFFILAKNGKFKSSITTATIAHLPGVKLKKLSIPVPPIDLQRRFSNLFNEIKSIQLKSVNGLKKIEILNSSIQTSFFTN